MDAASLCEPAVFKVYPVISKPALTPQRDYLP
jgi:hypothetical protein